MDYLADQQFPVERVAIVGHDVKLVEQVVGRMSYGRAALHGASSGAVTGVLIGWIFGLLSWIEPLLTSLTLAVYGLVFGAIVGAVISLVTYALQGGRRDFTAVQHMVPSRYEVLVDTEVADEAARLLQQREGTSGDVTGPPS
ncbi:general stress protein [Saccharopolyspora rhizosphaerae]|uniref:general stress protein n=1 Tax=Saccharopolyspora rhizosphaerae TaxID=2492662 RepID=UPI001F45017D